MLDLLNTILTMAVPAAGVGISLYATTIRTKAALDFQSRELSRLEERMEKNIQETRREIEKLVSEHHEMQIKSIQLASRLDAKIDQLQMDMNHIRGEILNLPDQFVASLRKNKV